MHPQIIAMAAAERVKDMQAQATRGRRAREARRARRGAITVSASARPVPAVAGRQWATTTAGRTPAAQVPCPQPPCPPVTARAA